MSPAARKPRKTGGEPPKAKAEARKRVTPAKKAAARRAVAKAKDPSLRTTTGELLKGKRLHLRNLAIVNLVDAGWSVQDAAAEFGVSRRTAAAAVERARALRSPLDATPMAILEGLMKRSAMRRQGLEALAVKYENVNPSAAVGAAKAAGEEDRVLAEMLVEMGKMPESLEWFRTTAEVSHLVGELLDRLDELEQGAIGPSEVRSFMVDVVMGNRPLYDADTIEGQATETGDGDDGVGDDVGDGAAGEG